MLRTTLAPAHPSVTPVARERPDPGPASIEAVQLARLARTVLEKSPDDLGALAEANPALVWEWLAAFRVQRLEAEAGARMWAAAAAALSTAVPAAVRTAAE